MTPSDSIKIYDVNIDEMRPVAFVTAARLDLERGILARGWLCLGVYEEEVRNKRIPEADNLRNFKRSKSENWTDA